MAKCVPLVSVLVPTYNGARFLDETLLSVRRQTHRNLEIIIRDDASTDETPQIVHRNAEEDRRIRVEHADVNSGGGTTNFVELAKLANGEFIKYCNQDDLLEPTCVAELVSGMSRPSVTLATSARRLIDASGRTLPARAYTAPLGDRSCVFAGRDVIRHMAVRALNQIGEPSTALFRNGTIDADQLFRLDGQAARVNGDVYLWLQLLTEGDLYFHRQELSSFRIHDAQFSGNETTFVIGNLEWVDTFRYAIELGVIADGAERAQTAANLLAVILTVAARVSATTDSRLRATGREVEAAVSYLRSLAHREAVA